MYISSQFQFTALAFLFTLCIADQWPYQRCHGRETDSGDYVHDKTRPEFVHDSQKKNEFGHWLHKVHEKGDLFSDVFASNSLPHHASWDDIFSKLQIPPVDHDANQTRTKLPQHVPQPWPQHEADVLFKNLPYPLDPSCLADRSSWWYRKYDGSCNWLEKDHTDEGKYGTAKSRDYDQHYYADNISSPREGPNPRAVSNAFFKRKESIFYEHTPLLLGLVEFIMHDISWSQDAKDCNTNPTECISVSMPDDEDIFDKNTTLKVYRTEAVPGTGTSPENPRENLNRASTWLDVSSLYGSTPDTGRALRSFKGGKLLTQDVLTKGNSKKGSYLPYNSMIKGDRVSTRTRPGVDVKDLFAGGDPRTNEDWIMLSVHTLFLREHNRLCDLLAAKKPELDDEELFQTARLLLGAKFSLIGNAYQMAYFKEMDWPADDGFPLYREMKGDNWLQLNPANTYPWPLAMTKANKPVVVSAEMAVVYRFHEFIISSFPIKDATNTTMWEQNVFDTGFNASGFIDTGLENILRGVVSTHIPNFKSGVDEAFRSAGKYRGAKFDIVVASIVHEREQGLPTFNNYFRAYNAQNPKVLVPIRTSFSDFSSDPDMVASLERLYATPDDVDLVVGCQLDESFFPHATIPTSSLIISLFSLISMGNSDRFSVGFAAMRCLLVDTPWDCHPSNALEDLLWSRNSTTLASVPAEIKARFPDMRFYDDYWMAELDFQAHGKNLLWRLVTENTEIKCLQLDPLFPVDPVTNPVLCTLPPIKPSLVVIGSTAMEVVLEHVEAMASAGSRWIAKVWTGFVAARSEL